jgi:hypothetical protein
MGVDLPARRPIASRGQPSFSEMRGEWGAVDMAPTSRRRAGLCHRLRGAQKIVAT